MVLYDRTFCSNINCTNKKCTRNQNNYNFKDGYISVSDFPKCDKFTKNR